MRTIHKKNLELLGCEHSLTNRIFESGDKLHGHTEITKRVRHHQTFSKIGRRLLLEGATRVLKEELRQASMPLVPPPEHYGLEDYGFFPPKK